MSAEETFAPQCALCGSPLAVETDRCPICNEYCMPATHSPFTTRWWLMIAGLIAASLVVTIVAALLQRYS